jgi:hypothetical protein
MMKIYGLLQDAKRPNCSTMAAQFEVSSETVKRDIAFMRDSYALPIEYDAKGHGFYFSRPVDRFPGVPVTEKELFAVCVANKVVDQYRGTSLQQPLERAFQRFTDQLDDQERLSMFICSLRCLLLNPLQNPFEFVKFVPFRISAVECFSVSAFCFPSPPLCPRQAVKPNLENSFARRCTKTYPRCASMREFAVACERCARSIKNRVYNSARIIMTIASKSKGDLPAEFQWSLVRGPSSAVPISIINPQATKCRRARRPERTV